MSAELQLVTDLAIILIAAGVFTLISKALKQPLVLGYIIAGFIVGPNLGLFPQFSPESVHQWSELGIIFLLFGLGLEFNFKKLLAVGSSAIIAETTRCILMFVVGYIVGSALGWTSMESIFLGGMMSMSSTTIIIKAYEDMGYKDKPYAPLVFGMLVVEDLLAVLLMVIFSTLAVSNKFSGLEMLTSLAKLVIFLVMSFVVGIYAIPTLFNKSKKYLSDEILLLVSVGLCLLMVWFANKMGFSSALGAFIIGSILSSTVEGERIEHITLNIKNLFGAIFFISVGMMVDPAVIAQNWNVILILTVAAVLGLLVVSTVSVLVAGKSLDIAVHAGFTLSQLGEFSFIIASLGCTLGVLRESIYPVIIAVSVITTFTTPYMIKAAAPASAWLHRVLPDSVVRKLSGRQENTDYTSRAEEGNMKRYMKSYFLRIGIYALILYVITLVMNRVMNPVCDLVIPRVHGFLLSLIQCVVTLAVMTPFLLGLSSGGQDLRILSSKLIAEDSKAKLPIYSTMMLRIFLATFFVVTPIIGFFNLKGWGIVIAVAIFVAVFLLFGRRLSRLNNLERQFFSNLNEREEQARAAAPVSTLLKEKLSDYRMSTATVVMNADSRYVGMMIKEVPIRDVSGVNIIKILRGTKTLLVPSGHERLMPGDRILAVGTKEQLSAFSAMMKDSIVKGEGTVDDSFVVEPLEIGENSFLKGKVLKDTDMRNAGCMVVSVLRNGEVYANPRSDFRFQDGDTVWLAGDQASIDWYK